MSDITYQTPYDNIFTKVAFGAAILWVGFMGIKYAKYNEQSPGSRKNRQALTATNIDHQVDRKNRAMGAKVPSNPDIPFFSRHNYNRRRRLDKIV